MAKKRSATRRILFVALGLLILLVIAGVVGRATGLIGGEEDAVEVEVADAERRTLTQVVTASGRVQPETEVNISPDVSGEIITLNVREGDHVEQGDLLVRIKPDFYTAQAEQAEAGVLQAQASQAQRRADLLNAELELKRQRDLFDKQAVSESDFQRAETQFDVAKAAFEAAEYAVQSAKARAREANEQLAKTAIYAPMSGTVSRLNVELGERVVGTSQMAGTEMMRIAQLDQMEVEVDVNENDVINVAIGDTARIEIDAYPEQPFRGVVTEIANSARTSASGTQEQVTNFPVKVRLLSDVEGGMPADAAVDSDEVPVATAVPVFRPGMSGTVDIFTETVSGAIAVPIQAVTVRDFNQVQPDTTADGEAVRADGEDLRRVLFVVDEGVARMVEVETGISDDTHIHIADGLEGGESVVIGPYRAVSRTLEPGDAVTIMDPPSRGGSGAFAAD